MDRKIKGCPNERCRAHKRKMYFKESEHKCPICGEELVYVCKKCYKIFGDGSKSLCPICDAERQDKNDKMKKIARKGGTVALGIGGIAITMLTSDKRAIKDNVTSLINNLKS